MMTHGGAVFAVAVVVLTLAMVVAVVVVGCGCAVAVDVNVVDDVVTHPALSGYALSQEGYASASEAASKELSPAQARQELSQLWGR